MTLSAEQFEYAVKRLDNGFNHIVGLSLESITDDCCTVSLEISAEHLNPSNYTHGGVLFTLMDVSAGLAATYYGSSFRSVVTQCADIHFLKMADLGKIVACSTVIKSGNNTAVVKVDISNSKGDLIASGLFDFFYI